MPTYDYVCRACEHRFEHFQSMQEPSLRKCPECGRPRLERLIGSGAGILFKGSGFYETDYKRKSGGPAASDGSGNSGSKTGGKSSGDSDGANSTPTDSKSDSTSGSKGSAKAGSPDGAGKRPPAQGDKQS